MNEEYIKAIHAAYGEDKLGSYDDFYSEITSNKDYRDLVYNQLGGSDVFGEYADFEDLVSIKQEDTQKKKTTQPYQPTSEEPTEVSKIPSESIDLGVYPTAFTPKEDIERVSEAGGISDEKLKRKASEIALESTSTLRKQQKELETQIKGYQEVFNNSKTRLEDIQLEFSELNDNLSNKYGLYYNQETGAYDIPKSMQPQFNQDVSVLNQLQKDFEAVQQGIKDNANAYRNSANRYAINKEALAQRGTPIGTFMTNLISEGVPTIVGGLGAAAVDLTSYTRPDLLAMRMAGGGAEQYVRLGAEELRGKVDKVQDEMSNFLYDKIGVNVGSTKEYIEQQTEEGDFWNIAAGGLGTSIPAMLTAGLTGGASFYAQMYDFADEAVKDVEGLSEGEKVAYKTTVAAITGALEKYGFSSLLKNKSITNSVVGRVLKRLPSVAKGKSANVSDDFINIVLDEGRIANATMNRFGQKAIDVGTRMATGFLAEAETGGLQSLAENSIEQSINLLKGEEVFDSKDWYDFTKEFLFDAAAEGVGGFAISGTIELFSKRGATQKQFDAAAKYLGDIRLEAIGAALEADVEAGNMTKEQAKATYDKIKQYKEDLARLPEDFPDSKKGEAVSLIQKRNGLQEKLGKVDESFKPKVQQEIDNINAKLAEMGSVSDADIAAREAEVAAKEAEEELSFFEDIVEGGASEARRVYDEEKARVEANADAEVERIVSGQEAMAETEAREAQRKANIAEATVTGETMAVEREAAKPSKRDGDKAKPKDLTKTEGEQDFTEAERPTPITSAPATRTPEQEKMGAMVSRAKEAQRKARQERANKKAVEEAVKTPLTAEVSEDIGPEVDFVTDDELADAMVQGAETPSVNDKILNILDKAIDATSTKGRAFDATLGLPMFMANSALKIVRAAYKGGMSLADAVKKGYNFVRSQGYELDLDAFDAYVKQSLTGKKETEDAVQEQTAGEVPVQPEAEVGGEMEEGVPDTEPQEATQEGKKPRVAKDKKGITSLMERVFGLNKSKSKAAARIYDIAIGTIAERAGITKEEVYRRFGFVKGKKEQLKGKGNVLFQSLSSSVWESTAKRGIEAIKQNAATPEQWMKMITDKGGKGTSQELEWIGLQDFLNEYVRQNNAKSVPKEVVEQYINDNQIEIVEVAKSKDWGKSFEEIRDELDAVDEKLRNEGITARGVSASRRVIDNGKGSKYYNDVLKRLNDKTKKKFDELIDKKFNEEPKFSGYALEGGENYREVLLTLPNNKKSDQKFYKKEHFDEANILAHLRLNERTLPNGERVLFIEEVQSDWAQEGKKRGFREDKSEKQIELERIEKRIPELEKKLDEIYLSNRKENETRSEFRRRNQEFNSLAEEYSSLESRRKELSNDIERIDDSIKIPDMPYKKTDQWVGMAMRRAMQMAAQEGFDRIAWATGEQSADRYDLSKTIEGIERYKGENPNEITVNITPKDQGTIQLDVSQETGKVVSSPRNYEFIGKDLSDIVGKELAEDLISSNEQKDYGSLDLKVGGEGMKAFYNSILPKVAKKEAQRFDKKANVEVVDFRGRTRKIDVKETSSSYEFFVDGKKIDVIDKSDAVNSKDEAMDSFLYFNPEYANLEGAGKQLSIAITPEMRMNLNSAIPLFQGEQGAMVVAEDGNYIIYALTDPNVSTPLHELAHVYEHYLTEQERADIEAWSGHKSGTVEFSEAFARGFEKYLQEGKAPTDKLKKVFENFKKWLTEIYDGITGSEIDLELNDEMRGIYDAMLEGENKETARRRQRNTIKEKIDKSIVSKLPFLSKFNPEHSYTVAQAELIDKFIDEYVKTGSLKGSGNVEALINGVSNMASLKQKAKTGFRKVFLKFSYDSKDVNKIRAMSSSTLIAELFGSGFEKVLSAIGGPKWDASVASAIKDSSNFIASVKPSMNKASATDVGQAGDIKMFAVGFVEQIYQRFVADVGEETAIKTAIRFLEKSIQTQEESRINSETLNLQKEALDLIKDETTIEGVLSKLTDGQRAVYESVIKANDLSIDEVQRISIENGKPLEKQNRYLHIPTRATKNELKDLTPEEFLTDPDAIGYVNPFDTKIFEKTSGAQEARVKDIQKLSQAFEEGSLYLEPSFILQQHNSFFNTRLAVYSHQAIVQMNAALGAKEAREIFGGKKHNGAENISAVKDVIKRNMNANRISAYTLSNVPAIGGLYMSLKRNAIPLAMGSIVQPIKQGTVIITTAAELTGMVGGKEAGNIMARSRIFAFDYFSEKVRSRSKGDLFDFKNLPWNDLIMNSQVGVRNTLDALEFSDQLRNISIISSFAPARTLRKGWNSFRDYWSAKSIVTPDRAAAQIGWLNYYEAYMIKNGLLEPSSFYKDGSFDADAYRDWYLEQGMNPNQDAVAYASNRILQYQGPSTQFERSELQGAKDFNSKFWNASYRIIRDTLFAMQSFSFGTSSTQMSSILQLAGKDFTKEDKRKALISLAGIGTSFAVFNGINVLLYKPLLAILTSLISEGVDMVSEGLGLDDDDENELNEKLKTLYQTPEDFRRALSIGATNTIIESSLPFLSQIDWAKYYVAYGMDFMAYSLGYTLYGEEMVKKYGDFGSGGFTVWQESSQMRPQTYKPRTDIGYLSIVPEDAYELYKIFNAGVTGEYDNGFGTKVYLNEKQREDAFKIAGFMAFGYGIPAIPATTSKLGVDAFRGVYHKASDNYLAAWIDDFTSLSEEKKKEVSEDFINNMNNYYKEQYDKILSQYGDEAISTLKTIKAIEYDIQDYSSTSAVKAMFAALDGKEKASEGNIDPFLFNLSNRNITPIAKGNIINQRLKKFDDKKERNEYYGRFVYSGLFLYNMDELRAIMNHVAKLNEGGNDSK